MRIEPPPTGTHPAPEHNEQRRLFCITCSYPIGALATFCTRCGGLGANRPLDVSHAPEQTIRGGHDTAMFTVTLLWCREGSRPFNMSNASSLGSFTIAATSVTRVGSHVDDEIYLNDVTVSKHHAQFVSCKSGCSLQDQRSVNGTFVNGERIDETVLSSGDEIQIGRFRLLYLALPPVGIGPPIPTLKVKAA